MKLVKKVECLQSICPVGLRDKFVSGQRVHVYAGPKKYSFLCLLKERK